MIVVANEIATYLLDWVKMLSGIALGVLSTAWPIKLYLTNRDKLAAEDTLDKRAKEHELKKLEYERQLKRDREVIEHIVNVAFERNLSEMRATFMEMQRLLKEGFLK